MGIARKLYEASAADVWRAVRHRAPRRRQPAPPRRYQPVTRAFLESDAYRALMREHDDWVLKHDREFVDTRQRLANLR